MTEPEVGFSDRLPRPSRLRIGAVIGACLAVVLGAAVTMGASPSPAATNGAGASTAPDTTPAPSKGLFRDGFPGRGGFRGLGGFGAITITGIDGSSVALKTEDGWTRTITIGDSTTITKDGMTITASDLAVGDQIRFRQTRNSDGSFTVAAIEVVVPTVAGTVTEVGPTSITIRDRDGLSQTITTTAATTYRLGDGAGARSDVAVGATIIVAGSAGSGSTFSATSVTVVPARVLGSVTAVSASTITVQRRDGTTLTVHVDATTTYDVPGVTNADLGDVTVGMRILAAGRQRADGSLDATQVHAGIGGRGFHGGPFGKGTPGLPAPSASPEGSSDNG